MVELLPSILSADFARLADEVAAAERGGGTVIHVDVMDGHFVPNITIGPPVVKSLRKATKLPLDCHLMIENPDEYIPAFAEAGANWVSVHYEACRHLHRSLELIAHHGMKPGVVLNPATRVDLIRDILPMVHHVLIMSVNPGFGGQEFIPFSLDKIRRLAELRKDGAWHLESKWTAEWLTTRSPRSSKRERSCWWPGTPCLARGSQSEDARELLAAAREAAGRSRSRRNGLRLRRRAREGRSPLRGGMNRLSKSIVAAALAALVFAGVSAQAREKKPKHKKNEDLSANPLANVNSKQPDKELFDKAMVAMKKGRFDVARLDLQTMLNTYPDSEYRMRAKLAVGDTWFKEGGTAALTQAEAEYKDFITFFPQAPEAAEAQMKVGDIYYQQMEKPDRDYTNAQNAEQEYRDMINHVP